MLSSFGHTLDESWVPAGLLSGANSCSSLLHQALQQVCV
jgi:hypothetical protein